MRIRFRHHASVVQICKSMTRREFNSVALLFCFWALISEAGTLAATPTDRSLDSRYRIGKTLYFENFRHGLSRWVLEEEKPGRVTAKDGTLDIDVPAGITLWFKPRLAGPVMITYQATIVSAGGPNDRVSDLNCFWMATDPSSPNDLFAHPRKGRFSEYNTLLLYYVGLGGNGNKTTRFRRYIGSPTNRPLLPEDDLSSADHLIVPNREVTIRLIADGRLIQYFRDNVKFFEHIDPAPYTSGWFAFRTTKNHMRIRNLRISRLIPVSP